MSKFIYNICKFFRLPCFKKKNKIGILETKNLKESFQKSKKYHKLILIKVLFRIVVQLTVLIHYYIIMKNTIP